MQHTTKYQFNLIEPGDTFDAEPLNANARAAETQLLAREAAEQALDQRLTAADAANKAELQAAIAGLQTAVGTAGKTCRVAYGTYVGTGVEPNTLTLDFKPDLVFIGPDTGNPDFVLARPFIEVASSGGGTRRVTWGENSVTWHYGSDHDLGNVKDTTYFWLVFGEPLN